MDPRGCVSSASRIRTPWGLCTSWHTLSNTSHSAKLPSNPSSLLTNPGTRFPPDSRPTLFSLFRSEIISKSWFTHPVTRGAADKPWSTSWKNAGSDPLSLQDTHNTDILENTRHQHFQLHLLLVEENYISLSHRSEGILLTGIWWFKLRIAAFRVWKIEFHLNSCIFLKIPFFLSVLISDTVSSSSGAAGQQEQHRKRGNNVENSGTKWKIWD